MGNYFQKTGENPMKKIKALAIMALMFGSILGTSAARAEEMKSEEVALLNAINQSEIKAAKEAQKRNVPQEVKQFAEMMVTEHEQNMQETKDLTKQANIKPEETDAVKAFKAQSDAKLDSLKQLDDQQFARTFAQEMVADHQQALQKLDGFIQNANAQLKEHFAKTRSHVQMHLQQAQQLSSRLNK
jgi:putative membrane protein